MVQQQGRLSETTARWLFQQLMFAVDYCHRKGVANRDIKLDNLLLDKSAHGRPDFPILKVCDWGYAKSEVLQSLATSRVVSSGGASHHPASADRLPPSRYECPSTLLSSLTGLNLLD